MKGRCWVAHSPPSFKLDCGSDACHGCPHACPLLPSQAGRRALEPATTPCLPSQPCMSAEIWSQIAHAPTTAVARQASRRTRCSRVSPRPQAKLSTPTAQALPAAATDALQHQRQHISRLAGEPSLSLSTCWAADITLWHFKNHLEHETAAQLVHDAHRNPSRSGWLPSNKPFGSFCGPTPYGAPSWAPCPSQPAPSSSAVRQGPPRALTMQLARATVIRLRQLAYAAALHTMLLCTPCPSAAVCGTDRQLRCYEA